MDQQQAKELALGAIAASKAAGNKVWSHLEGTDFAVLAGYTGIVGLVCYLIGRFAH